MLPICKQCETNKRSKQTFFFIISFVMNKRNQKKNMFNKLCLYTYSPVRFEGGESTDRSTCFTSADGATALQKSAAQHAKEAACWCCCGACGTVNRGCLYRWPWPVGEKRGASGKRAGDAQRDGRNMASTSSNAGVLVPLNMEKNYPLCVINRLYANVHGQWVRQSVQAEHLAHNFVFYF